MAFERYEVGQCKGQVYDQLSWRMRRCARKAWKDGYCKQHHPDSVAKRQKENDKRYEEKRRNTPIAKLIKLRKLVRAILPAARFGNEEQSPPGFWDKEIEAVAKEIQ